MMNDMKAMRFLAVLAIGLMSVMSVKAQGQRMLEFQVMMSMHDTIYKNFIKDGKHKEAIAPLTTLINILDTTTICRDTEMSPEMVKAANADYLYDLACWYNCKIAGRETADYRSFGEADVQTFCQIFDRLSNEGISDPAELYRKRILEYLKIYE